MEKHKPGATPVNVKLRLSPFPPCKRPKFPSGRVAIGLNDKFMNYKKRKRAVRRARVYRSVAEKRRIVELTFLPGASVSLVAQAEGVNSHQVFDWRRAYRNGKLAAGEQESCKLLPVIVSAADAEIDAEGTAEGAAARLMPAGRCGLLHHRHTYRQQQARSTLNCPAGRRSGSRTAQMRRCCEL